MVDSLGKLDPRIQAHNPVMFVVEVTAAGGDPDPGTGTSSPASSGLVAFELQIALWLWFTVLFANFAEAMAEGRGKAQADNLRKTRTETQAVLLRDGHEINGARHLAAARRRGDGAGGRTLSPATAKLSRAWRRSMRPPLPESRRRSFARAAATAAP